MSKPKVAILHMPAHVWAEMSPQEKVLYCVQQLVGFMASPYYRDFDGVVLRVTVLETGEHGDVFCIGKPPSDTPSIIVPFKGD